MNRSGRLGSAEGDTDAAGFVLAGGRSSRMGEDKALLCLNGQPLLAWAIATLREAGLTAAIAGAQQDFSAFAPVIADRSPGAGPLAGVTAALAASTARLAVLLPVDLPLLPASLVRFLLFHARATGHAITVPSAGGFAQTFPAVVERRAAQVIESELQAGRRGCLAAFAVAARSLNEPLSIVPAELAAQAGQAAHPKGLPVFRWFLNMNEPRDLALAEALCPHPIA